jgi:hypothetical protein
MSSGETYSILPVESENLIRVSLTIPPSDQRISSFHLRAGNQKTPTQFQNSASNVATTYRLGGGRSGLSTSSLTMAAIDPSSETTEWRVYDYNPSNQAIAPRNSPNSMPATTSDGGMTWQFPFLPNTYTALFTTTDPRMTGNQSMTMLTDTISVMGPATTFMTQHGGGDCFGNTPAAVRFFFRSPSASGSSVGTPPAGFYTQFWWSNPMNLILTGNQSGTIWASMADPSEWSDWNGQRGDSNPTVTEAFLEATQKVQAIGLSFGGECFFETGVTAEYPAATPPPYEIISSKFSETQ